MWLTPDYVAEKVREAISYVAKACRNPRARGVCEELEDVILALLDEAGEPENVSTLATRIIAYAAEELSKAADELNREGLNIESELLRKAARILDALLASFNSK